MAGEDLPPDPFGDMDGFFATLKQMFDAAIRSGFTEQQSLTMISNFHSNLFFALMGAQSGTEDGTD
jgi:hypothetical protein